MTNLKNDRGNFFQPVVTDAIVWGGVLPSWNTTSFLKLAKEFALILGRRDRLLEAHPPDEQHAFRKHPRMDENWLTATLFLGKAWRKEFQCIVN